MKCGVYVPWGWRIRPMGVAYTSEGAKVAYKSKGPLLLQNFKPNDQVLAKSKTAPHK